MRSRTLFTGLVVASALALGGCRWVSSNAEASAEPPSQIENSPSPTDDVGGMDVWEPEHTAAAQEPSEASSPSPTDDVGGMDVWEPEGQAPAPGIAGGPSPTDDVGGMDVWEPEQAPE